MRIHVFDPVEGVGLAPWFEEESTGIYTAALAPGVKNPFRAYDRSPLRECEAAFIPNNFRHSLTPAQEAQVRAYADEAEAAGKHLFLFSCGDFTDRFRFDPRAYVFRYSVYRSGMKSQDIVAPTITRDQGVAGYTLRTHAGVPTISFCGQAGYQRLRQWLKYYLKVAFYRARATLQPRSAARILGVYWRRRMLRACERSSLVRTRFILRRSFSGASRTIELDPAQAHREFVASIVESDFVLAPKGDGNYSNRFLEALSLGRIPVLLDTDTILPLESLIDYERVVVRVPMQKVDATPVMVRTWYDALSQDEWKRRQAQARETFTSSLRFDSFFSRFFSEVLPALPRDPRERTGAMLR